MPNENTMSAIMSAEVYAQTAILSIEYTYFVPDPNYRNKVALHVVVEREDLTRGGLCQSYLVKLNAPVVAPNVHYSGKVSFPIYPLPSNSQIRILLYEGDKTYSEGSQLVTSLYINTNPLETDANYIDIKTATYTVDWTPPVLTESQKEHNVDIIYDVLSEDEWTIEAIACIAGCCDFYSDLNPNYNTNYLIPLSLFKFGYIYRGYNYLTPNASYTKGLQNNDIDGAYGTFSAQFGGYGQYYNILGITVSANGITEITKPNLLIPVNEKYEDYGIDKYRGKSFNAYIMPQDYVPYNMVIPTLFQSSTTARIMAEDSACMAFLPIYRQHFIDVMDKFSSTKWYETNSAFSLEQFLQYLIYNKEITDEYLLLFGANKEINSFYDFTKSDENPDTLSMKFLRSLSKFEFYESGSELWTYNSGYMPRPKTFFGQGNYRNTGSRVQPLGWYLNTYAMKWYRYLKNKHGKKRKMPIWEYLRYTI